MLITNPNVVIQLISSTVGCIGFAMWFRIRGKQVFYSGIGSLVTWITYLVVNHFTGNYFMSVMVGAMFVAAYAHIMARVNRAPATIFLTASVFPLIPGGRLYYTMYYVVMGEMELAKHDGNILLLTCVGIAVGFIVVEIFNKYILIGWSKFKKFYHVVIHGENDKDENQCSCE